MPIATAVWVLLPLVAIGQVGAGGYGLLLGALGLGAVAGSMVLPAVRRRVLPSLITVAFVLYALATAALAVTTALAPAVVILAVGGAAWLGLLSSLNASIQLVLPEWVRARGLSYYLVAVSVGQALGGVVLGSLASHLDLRVTLLAAAGALLLAAIVGRWLPVPDLSRVHPAPTIRHPPAEVDDVLDADVGPILVTLDYTVRAEATAAFVEAMAAVG